MLRIPLVQALGALVYLPAWMVWMGLGLIVLGHVGALLGVGISGSSARRTRRIFRAGRRA
jgi:hypothetical protein